MTFLASLTYKKNKGTPEAAVAESDSPPSYEEFKRVNVASEYPPDYKNSTHSTSTSSTSSPSKREFKVSAMAYAISRS